MTKISTLAAASVLALLPLTGANAEYEDPQYYGFAAQSAQPVQKAVAAQRAKRTRHVVPTHGKASTRRIRNQGKYNAFVFEGENASE